MSEIHDITFTQLALRSLGERRAAGRPALRAPERVPLDVVGADLRVLRGPGLGLPPHVRRALPAVEPGQLRLHLRGPRGQRVLRGQLPGVRADLLLPARAEHQPRRSGLRAAR